MKRVKQIRWLPEAREDVAAIVEFISADSLRSAERLIDQIDRLVSLLEHFPYLGAISPLAKRARMLIEGNYVIYYTVHRTKIVVRAVVHGAMLTKRGRLRLDK